ncbi:hypothetical protein [Herbiconiux sp. L3-i23]|uniref:hypothetical protein n=1 Tax=Herbiconiux sp. L3-i23 TaxID=2905871 RepID=UPI00204E62A4|nr:hypothetical protein [Herbiconiux sp. L3-i23]BDI21728.1 hypothetical protein L3i23_05040 [Herbiconiux sp. L3-i23]
MSKTEEAPAAESLAGDRERSAGLEIVPDELGVTVTGDWYRIWIPTDEAAINRSPYAKLDDLAGRRWTDINLLASVHRVDASDETFGLDAPRLRHEGDALVVTVAQTTSAWAARSTILRVTARSLELSVAVEGDGRIDDVVLFGGAATMRSGASGVFRSRIDFASLFAPVPTEPVAFVRPSRASAVLGVVGDADPGRLNGIFSPPPLVFGFGRETPRAATDLPGGDWLGLSVRDAVQKLTFTTARYEPLDGGFSLRLSYEGHTEVDGAWASPTLVLQPASSAIDVIADHRRDLVEHGFAAESAPVSDVPLWWDEPMFCGWGAQCARSMHALHHSAGPSEAIDPETEEEENVVVLLAPQYARQSVYDEFLDRLERHDLSPGTIVVDDRWQAEYGTATTDLEHWPDLKGWIAQRHAEGRKVLLWWKAWDPEGLPADECVTDPFGRPVAVDPANPAYLDRLRGIVRDLLSADGLDADGFKVDFTQRTPSGRNLRGAPGVWGIAALHRLLETLYGAAKEAKSDALVVMHAVHPSFGDVGDMVRLNDVLEKDVAGGWVPVADQLAVRHAIATAALPYHRIDTDQWPMPNRGEWLEYTKAQSSLGVPALYYLESIDRSGEPIDADDLAVVAETWREYRALLADRRSDGG